ncbi:TAXI family TRAP transporter solute-binding subunit, partial [Klebsiella pneumoniae]
VKLAPKHHFSLSAISSAGSGENVKLLNEDEAQFAILQGLYGAWAWSGEGPYAESGRQDQLRSVSMLWQNVEHFIVRSELAETGTVSD